MAAPGGGGEETNTKRFVLSPGNELRVEPKEGTSVVVQLVDGKAELFGAELSLGERVSPPAGAPFAIFTWSGATLAASAADGAPLDSAASLVYVADYTPMPAFINVHDALDARRVKAREGKAQGPRAMVVGPPDAGKSTLCRVLLNYAVRAGWAPLAVDLDVGQGSMSPPGTIAAAPVTAPIPPSGLAPDAPLVYWYGHASAGENPALFRFAVERLGGLLNRRAAAAPPDAAAAGWVVNWMGWADGDGYRLLTDAVSALGIDVVLVVGHDRLFAKLQAELGSRDANPVSIVKLPRSEGAVARDVATRRAARAAAVRSYFYGPSGDLQPASLRFKASELTVHRAGGGPAAPVSALPIGAAPVADPLRLEAKAPGPELLHSLLAVSHAEDPAELLTSNVAGFLYVSAVDPAAATLTLLAPTGGALPGAGHILSGGVKVFLE